ncbi:hypothetical protein DSO57_1012489 [Entomophthora muscae]|uniref:Uncharacterized protein n=1 Tax=Entomophthora muscae TaxID=34485 RepID=A0ACC2SIU6_9FUNG|nr:hypothetical protein DSO57_1012489 [Entomophthora muscae]
MNNLNLNGQSIKFTVFPSKFRKYYEIYRRRKLTESEIISLQSSFYAVDDPQLINPAWYFLARDRHARRLGV